MVVSPNNGTGSFAFWDIQRTRKARANVHGKMLSKNKARYGMNFEAKIPLCICMCKGIF